MNPPIARLHAGPQVDDGSRRFPGPKQHSQGEDKADAEGDGQREQGGYTRDLERRQSCLGIDTVSDRTARDHREA